MFEKWLAKNYVHRTAKDRFRYARQFYHCLLERDFSKLRLLSDSKRIHVMKALAALSKFLGIYDEFKMLVRNYGLKWSSRNGDDLIIARLTKNTDSKEIIEWIRTVKSVIPEYAEFMDFMAITGLRYAEAIKSWNLIVRLSQKQQLPEYYNAESETLEHYRFKEAFIRRSKKVFISFVPRTAIEKIVKSKPLTINILRNRLRRNHCKQRFGDIREFHASFLTKYVRQPEIDFLHGRISASVFMQNYFNPAWITDLKDRTLKAESEILAQIAP